MTDPVRDDELRDFFRYVIELLERLGVPYMVVGGFAAILYGEPRLTIDVDILVDMQVSHIRPFVAAFPIKTYYVSEEAIRDSLQRRYPFNVLQSRTGAKVDLVPLPFDPFSRAAFQARRRVVYDSRGHSAMFITAENIILAKLVAHKNTGSDKHLSDVRGVLVAQWGELDLESIRRGARGSGTLETFERIFETVRQEMEGD
jgi:hypothetical protein